MILFWHEKVGNIRKNGMNISKNREKIVAKSSLISGGVPKKI